MTSPLDPHTSPSVVLNDPEGSRVPDQPVVVSVGLVCDRCGEIASRLSEVDLAHWTAFWCDGCLPFAEMVRRGQT